MIVSSKCIGRIILINTGGKGEKEVHTSVGANLMCFLNQN